MDLKDIKKIVELMKLNELTEFELKDEGFEISLKRGNGFDVSHGGGSVPMAAPMHIQAAPAPAAPAAPAAVPAAPAAEPVDADAGLEDIKSPIVGTFYRSATPDAEAYVSVGQEVDEDTVVCIIEAMKVMNEIKAECRGVIKKVMVENSTPVEYGQPLFKIEPA